MRTKQILVSAICGLLVVLSTARSIPAQQNAQLEDVKLKGDLGSVLSQLAIVYEVPIGMEMAMNAGFRSSKIRVDFKRGTVEQLLTQIFADNKQYSWEIRDGVVNIVPKDGYRDSIVQKFLSTELEAFSIKEQTSTWAVEEMLIKTPEIRRLFDAFGLRSLRFAFSGFYIPQLGRKFKLDASNISVQSLLNRIVSDSPTAKFWVVNRDSAEHALSLSLSARNEDSLGDVKLHFSGFDDDDPE